MTSKYDYGIHPKMRNDRVRAWVTEDGRRFQTYRAARLHMTRKAWRKR